MNFPFRRSAPLVGAMVFSLSTIAPLAGAAQVDSDAQSIAANGVGVARLSLIDGNVAVQRGDSSDSLAAAPNAPLLGGDYITTGAGSRAEIQLDGYAHMRLGHDVQMRFTHLDTNNRSVQLAAGTIELRLLDGPDGSNAIDTPSIAIKARQAGRYRVTVTPDGQTLVTVRSGDAEIDSPQGAQDLQPGTTLVASGDADNPSVDFGSAIAFDDFDRFNADRDRADAPFAAQAAYLDPAIGGAADLGASGRWVMDGSYGHVWVPAAVGPDWAPYRDGRWVWEEGYGWTWVADEPWGWAPYHYGSWYDSPRYGWCWYPPHPHIYVPWRPALVAFIGFGVGSGIALNFGGYDRIGWVPLAPFEPYHPWWGDRYGHGTTINNTTIVNTTNITNVTNNDITIYRNARYTNAVTSVSSRRFAQGDFTHATAVSAPQLREARVFHGALPVVPTASNLRFARSTAAPAVGIEPASMQHSFAGNRSVVQRTPFTAQRATLAAATHTALTPQTIPAGAASNAWSRFSPTRTPGGTNEPRHVPQTLDEAHPAVRAYHAEPAGPQNATRETLHDTSPREVPYATSPYATSPREMQHGLQPNLRHAAAPYDTRHTAPSATQFTAPGETHHAPRSEMQRALPNASHHAAPQTHRAPSDATHHSPPNAASPVRTSKTFERAVTTKPDGNDRRSEAHAAPREESRRR